jgi:hypothetical protein
MASKIIFKKDKKVWTQMKKNLRKGKSSISVGWFEEQKYGSDNENLPMAQVAQWVEEGQSWQSQPPRPAIRTIFIPLVSEAKEFTHDALPMIHMVAMGGMTWKGLHVKLAPKVLNMFQGSIRAFQRIPNKPSTIAKKGFNDPWIETGALVNSARFKVEGYKLFSSRSYSSQSMGFK